MKSPQKAQYFPDTLHSEWSFVGRFVGTAKQAWPMEGSIHSSKSAQQDNLIFYSIYYQDQLCEFPFDSFYYILTFLLSLFFENESFPISVSIIQLKL